ncbi:hypothetical protein U9M48_026644 [Paspalum notatum var. saurae]|uniref:BTB domain-containing protein n=1 Tax=Paspalum notatum var. saurae TaxID=547442 RepID=A0AAQ3WZE0_PASNO
MDDRRYRLNACTNVTETAQSVQLLKINGFSTASLTMTGKTDYIECHWEVDGHEWELRLYPAFLTGCHWVAVKFIYLGGARASVARTEIRCRQVDPTGCLHPSDGKTKPVCREFTHPGPGDTQLMLVIKVSDALVSDHLLPDDDSLTVECSITVIKELKRITIPAKKEEVAAIPPSDLHQHLGELLRSQKGADVTFAVAGESFAAHKLVLAERSPVFMAEFFGGMAEGSSGSVEIVDMDPAVFRAMLQFIYTDTAPELDDEAEPEPATAMAQHLLAAADRYGLERLKLVCEGKLCDGVDVDTAATTLALAEQHGCSLLKEKCVQFITGSPETLEAVTATEGYKHLVVSGSLVPTELLKAACARKDN